ncbi:MAG TPA: PEP-CTERM sorting domain-containing protein [Pyrinomonadaceae bacterium]|nr:PEP-CTERM sorting domain-containing protein [Pyrinomonadaceae bacterium]
MPPRLLTPAFLLVLFLAASAHADPVVFDPVAITGGTAQFVRTSSASATWTIDVSGDGFHLTGTRFPQRTPPCDPCPSGTVVSFNDTLSWDNQQNIFPPRSLGLTVGGVPYGGPQFLTIASLTIRADPVQIIVPPDSPEIFTIVIPFTASGGYSIRNNMTGELFGSGSFTGRGSLEAVIRRLDTTPPVSALVTQSVTYRFDDATATPEPASLTLLGLGGGAAWLLRRRRVKR